MWNFLLSRDESENNANCINKDDPDLTTKGLAHAQRQGPVVQEMIDVASGGKKQKFDAFVTSTLQRTIRTAAALDQGEVRVLPENGVVATPIFCEDKNSILFFLWDVGNTHVRSGWEYLQEKVKDLKLNLNLDVQAKKNWKKHQNVDVATHTNHQFYKNGSTCTQNKTAHIVW